MENNELWNSIHLMRARMAELRREGEYWDKEENEKLTDLFYDGVGISEIAIIHQRSEAAIMQQIEKLDLYRRKEMPLRRKGFRKPTCLCEKCNVSYSCPYYHHQQMIKAQAQKEDCPCWKDTPTC